jgi:outer membrane protein assembly factor BamD (BamD/ComL family)
MLKKFKIIIPQLLIISAVNPLAFAFSDPSVDNMEIAILAQNYKQAKVMAENFVAGNPNHQLLPQIQYELSVILLRNGMPEQAREILNKLLTQVKDPYFQDKIKLALFDTYYWQESFAEAQEVIDPLMNTRHKSEWTSQIYLRQARVYLKQAKWDEARLLLARIMNEYDRSMEVEYARQLLQEKQYFTVQIGAFGQRKSAERMIEDLKAKGEYAYIVESYDKNNSRLYRVRVGRFSFLNEAKNLRTRLCDMGYSSARIYP